MTDTPRDYDQPFTKTGPVPGSRIRVGYDQDRATVTRFVVQLEYRLGEEWREVVRLDHDAEGSDRAAHDVTEDGLHADVYRDGEKIDTVKVSGPLPAAKAFTAAEEHLATHAERYINRFQKWHPMDRSDE